MKPVFPIRPPFGYQPGPRLFYVAHCRETDGSRSLRWPQAKNRRDTFILTPDGLALHARDGERVASFKAGERGHDAILAAFRLFDARTPAQRPPAL